MSHETITISLMMQWLSNFIIIRIPVIWLENFFSSVVDLPFFDWVIVELDSFYYLLYLLGIFCIALAVIAVVLVLQQCCSVCSDADMSYTQCEKVNAFLMNLILMISSFVVTGLSLYFFLLYFDSTWDGIHEVQDEIMGRLDVLEEVIEHGQYFEEIYELNFTMPEDVLRLFDKVDSAMFLYPDYVDTIPTINLWIVVSFLILIDIFSILGIYSSFKKVKRVYICTGVFFFFAFILLFAFTFLGAGVSFLFSDFCTTGIDQNTANVVENFFNDTCIVQVLENFMFCKNETELMCDPLGNFSLTMYELLDYVTHHPIDDIDNDELIDYLEENILQLHNLQSCTVTQVFYLETTTRFCVETTGFAISLTALWQMLLVISFLMIMVIFFSIHRIFSKHKSRDLQRMELLFVHEGSEDSAGRYAQPVTKDSHTDIRVGCVINVSLLCIIWLAMLFITFIIVSSATSMIDIPR